LEEVTEYAGDKVLMEVDDNSAQIIGDPRGILGQQLRPRTFHLLIIIIILITNKILNHIVKLTNVLTEGGN
jgi:hypothetical protein